MPRVASARRYAQAVFDLARERDELQQWLDDLTLVAGIFSDLDILSFLENPKVRFEQKTEVLEGHLAGVSPLARNLALLLVQKGRARLGPALLEEYQRYLDAQQGIAPAEIVTAIPLDQNQQEQIARRLREAVGRELRLSITVDPQILGGLVARVGDRVLDGSTRSRLNALRDSLRANPS